MFNLQGGEIIIVLLLALVVLGPEKLPDAMRKVGKLVGELRKMSSGFQEEFRKAVDEPMREVRETATLFREAVDAPVREVRGTADLLRDSADLTRLAGGERAEKPKSAEMYPVPAVEAAPATEPVPVEPANDPFRPAPAAGAATSDDAADGTA